MCFSPTFLRLTSRLFLYNSPFYKSWFRCSSFVQIMHQWRNGVPLSAHTKRHRCFQQNKFCHFAPPKFLCWILNSQYVCWLCLNVTALETGSLQRWRWLYTKRKQRMSTQKTEPWTTQQDKERPHQKPVLYPCNSELLTFRKVTSCLKYTAAQA